MNYVNGTTTDGIAPAPVATAVPASAGPTTPATRIDPSELRAKLLEPFDPAEIKWRVTATTTTQTKRGPQKRGQLVAYADQRAYTDRLNEVFGEWGWTRTYNVQVAQNFERRSSSDRNQTAVSAKVVVVSTVTAHGLGSHTGVGEEWADDENAATRAEAQAFKRACACFGLGRYLYDLDKAWVDLDQHNRPVETPRLPDWAQPGAAQRKQTTEPRPGIVREELLAKIRELRGKVGHGLSGFVLSKYAGGAEPEKCGHAKLTLLLEKLTDIGNGVARLRRAAEIVGGARYAAICRELNLASESVDDIPSRDALKSLVARVEGEAAGKGDAAAKPPVSIVEARGRLLQAARMVGEHTGKRLADIISESSAGKLTLDGLKNLTEADLPAVSAAISRIQ